MRASAKPGLILLLGGAAGAAGGQDRGEIPQEPPPSYHSRALGRGRWLGRGSQGKQRLNRTCLDNLRRRGLAGGPGEYHLLGVHQETAVACDQAGEVGGFWPLHQQHQRLEGKRGTAREGKAARLAPDQCSEGLTLGKLGELAGDLAPTQEERATCMSLLQITRQISGPCCSCDSPPADSSKEDERGESRHALPAGSR